MREHLVGDDDRDRDRNECLAKILALRPAENELRITVGGRDDRRPASAGTIQCVRLTCELCKPKELPPPIMSRWSLRAT
jgi:hypothetical protein